MLEESLIVKILQLTFEVTCISILLRLLYVSQKDAFNEKEKK